MAKLKNTVFWQQLKTEIYNNRQLPTWVQPAKPLPRSVKFRHVKKRGLTLTIPGLSPVIEIWLSVEGNITVTANWVGKCDFLYDSDLLAANNTQGYYCLLCEERHYYRQYLLLWHDHVLHSFISWCESTLLTADCIVFFGAETGLANWNVARLAQRSSIKDDCHVHVLPLWQPSAVMHR